MSASLDDRPTALRAATTLALWAAAHAGGTDADATLAALRGLGIDAGVRAVEAVDALPGPGEAAAGTATLLPLLRRSGPARLVIPVPGDLRGLPPGSALAADALQAGAAVAFPAVALALVPLHGQWRVHRGATDHPALAERDARMMVDEAIRVATAQLHRADIASRLRDPRVSLRAMVRSQDVPLPPGLPDRAAGLLASAITLHSVLLLVQLHGTAAATSRQLGAVNEALAPLGHAAREARRTAVALGAEALATADAAAALMVSRRTAR